MVLADDGNENIFAIELFLMIPDRSPLRRVG